MIREGTYLLDPSMRYKRGGYRQVEGSLRSLEFVEYCKVGTDQGIRPRYPGGIGRQGSLPARLLYPYENIYKCFSHHMMITHV